MTNTLTYLWCIENNGDPEHCWWANSPALEILFKDDPSDWFQFIADISNGLQHKMQSLGVPIDKLVWQFGYGPPLPSNPTHFEKRKFN